MKFVKWVFGLFFLILLSIVLVKTALTEPFSVSARPWLFGFYVTAVPIYLYVIGAFFLGVLLSGLIAVGYFIRHAFSLNAKNKRIAHLEKEMETLNASVVSLKSKVAEIPEGEV